MPIRRNPASHLGHRPNILLPLHAQKLLASPIGAECKARYPDYGSELEALNELGVSVCYKGSSAECLIRNKHVRLADLAELVRVFAKLVISPDLVRIW